MTTHATVLRARTAVAQGTAAFHFDKPAGFAFEPGQAIDVVLSEPPGDDAQSARHTFSLVSAPFEGELVVATRMRDSAFKRALGALPAGAGVAIEGPFGTLMQRADRQRPAVFIAGGIGITPFMSLLRQAAHDGMPQRRVLLYSNRRPEDAAFLAELTTLAQQCGNFRLLATMTAMSQSSLAWDGSTGPIDEALLARAAEGLAQPVYVIAGPPAMAEAMHLTLAEAGVSDPDIRSESFYGY
jgi:ferredoxin-NADP reductase